VDRKLSRKGTTSVGQRRNGQRESIKNCFGRNKNEIMATEDWLTNIAFNRRQEKVVPLGDVICDGIVIQPPGNLWGDFKQKEQRVRELFDRHGLTPGYVGKANKKEHLMFVKLPDGRNIFNNEFINKINALALELKDIGDPSCCVVQIDVT
jgi:hypothetical protein